MITRCARPASSRVWSACPRHALPAGRFYHTSTSNNVKNTTRGTDLDDSVSSQDIRKIHRLGNNTSRHAVQQLTLTPQGRDKIIRSKATWEHASDRTFIDLNPGLGGFHYAFRRHDYRLLCAIEQDPQNAELYRQNFRGAKVKTGQLSSGILPHFASVLCLPCRDTDGEMIFQILELVAKKPSQRRPLVLLIEHTPSFASVDQDRKPTGQFARMQEQLAGMGYTLQWRIYDTSRFGLPLQRERLFMIAVKASYSSVPFEFPNSPYTRAEADEFTVRSILENPTSVSLDNLLFKGPGEVHWKERPDISRNVINMGHYNETREDNRQRFIIVSDLGHVPSLDPDAPFFIRTLGSGATSLTPNTPRSRSSTPPPETDEDGRSMIVRRLTIRELARLWGFSDDTHLWSEQRVAWKHIAYSVSPRIADALASAITVQYFTGPQKRPKAYWDGAKDANLPLMNDLLKRLEGDIQLLRRDLSLAKEQVIGHNIELRELRRKLEEMERLRHVPVGS